MSVSSKLIDSSMVELVALTDRDGIERIEANSSTVVAKGRLYCDGLNLAKRWSGGRGGKCFKRIRAVQMQ